MLLLVSLTRKRAIYLTVELDRRWTESMVSSPQTRIRDQANGCRGLHCTEFDAVFPKLNLPFRRDLTHITAVKTDFAEGRA